MDTCYPLNTLENLAMGGLNGAAMMFSGKQVTGSGKELARMARQDAPRKLSKVKEKASKAGKAAKEELIRFHYDNRGSVDLDAFVGGGSGTSKNGVSYNPKTVRRFMSKQEYKQFKKNGFTYDPNDSRGGISTTTTNVKPYNPDAIKNKTGALGADYYVDIDVSNKNVFYKGPTKSGLPDWKIKDNVDVTDIVGSGKVRK